MTKISDKELYDSIAGHKLSSPEVLSGSGQYLGKEYILFGIKACFYPIIREYGFYLAHSGYYKKVSSATHPSLWEKSLNEAIIGILKVVFDGKLSYLRGMLKTEEEGRNNPRRCSSLQGQIEKQEKIFQKIKNNLNE